ncbi:MAG: LCP family protein [Candidatus Saccharibacteria bacterium]
MYKFQSDKPNKQRAMDGILSSGPRNSKIASQKKSANSAESMIRSRQTVLDDFNKPEGFSGRTMPKLNSNGARLSATIPAISRGKRQSLVGHNLPPAIKKRKRRNSTSYKVLTRSAIVLVLIVLVTGGFVFGKAWWSAHKVFKGGGAALAFDKNIDPNMLNGEGDGRVNILVMGKGGETEAEGGELTDSMMIVSIDPINTKIALLSIPRDLWVKPQGLWPMKINAVYSSAKYKALDTNPKDKAAAEAAGIAKVSSVVEQYMGVHMHYNSMVEFSAFEEAVNTLGGIDVTLPEAFNDYSMLVGNKYLSLPAGTQHLDGGYALAYARSRHGSARGDFDRGQQQQTVLVGIKDKILSLGTYSNPIKITELLSTFGSRVQTNLSINDMMRVYGIIKQLGPNDITHADLAQIPDGVVTTGSVGDQSVVLPKAGVDNYTEVRAFVRNKLKDGFLVKENPSVIVLNGTDNSGAAQKRADELKGYGYNVTKIGDAPVKNATTNQIIDLTKGMKKYTKRYLEQRFGVMAVSSADGIDSVTYPADFVVIVGP